MQLTIGTARVFKAKHSIWCAKILYVVKIGQYRCLINFELSAKAARLGQWMQASDHWSSMGY